MSTSNNEFCFLKTVPHSKKPELIREMANSKFGTGDNMSKGQMVLEEKETLESLTGHVRELRSQLDGASTAPDLW